VLENEEIPRVAWAAASTAWSATQGVELCRESWFCFDEATDAASGGAQVPGGAMRRLYAAIAIGAILTSTLVACVPQQSTSAATSVGADGLQLSIDGVRAVAPPGVAPEGTEAALQRIDRVVAADLAGVVSTLAAPISLTLGDGLQPASPIDLRFDIDESALSGEEWASDDTLMIITQSEDGTIDLLPTQREGDVLVATTNHLSWFQPIQLDLGAALQSARTFVMESLGLEYPAPDCVGQTATASDGAEYSILQGSAVHSCIKAAGDTITVNLYAATAMPYRVKSWPAVTGGALPGTDSGSILMTLASKWVPSASGGVLMGGGSSAQFEFTTANPPQFLEARQDAHMLIGSVLLNLVGIILRPLSGGAELVTKIGQLDCLSGVLTTGSSDSVDASTAASIFRTFLACVNTLGPAIPLPAAIVLGLLGAVPALVAGSAIGLVNEITGKAVERIEVSSSVTPWVVSAEAVGPLKIGQTTWGDATKLTGFLGDVGRWSGGCAAGGWYETGTIYDGVSVLTADQNLPSPTNSTLDVISVGGYFRTGVAGTIPTATREGVELGSSQADVESAYPTAKVTSHPLSESLHLYSVEDGLGHALVITVEDGKVSALTAGSVPEVYAPEGCA
jgi:hypothetical protein